MEDFNQPLDAGLRKQLTEEDNELRITPEIQAYWSETGKWALFQSILMLIPIVAPALFLLGISEASETITPAPGIVASLFYAALLLMPAVYLIRFWNHGKRAIATDSTEDMEASFKALRGYYQYFGIVTIIVLSLFVIMFLFVGGALLSGPKF